MAYTAEQAAARFDYQGKLLSCEPYGNGHINDTYLVKCQTEHTAVQYILQRMNRHVFQDIDILMENIVRVTGFLKEKITARGGDPLRETLSLVPAKSGGNYISDPDGHCWRSYRFITGAVCYEKIQKQEDFYHCGAAFGAFQSLLADFPADRLHEIIPNFHNTPSRYRDFEEAVKKDVMGRAASAEQEIRFIQARKADMSQLTEQLEQGKLPLRVTHNDTKLNNCMFDMHTGKAICVIDLDTVMPGLRAYDFGDSIRFGASTAAEDETDLDEVSFSLPLFEQYTKGFMESCGNTMTEAEASSLPIGARLMTLECGMRFLADYLQGDVYFKISRNNHNLERCRTQLKLVAEMEQQQEAMIRILQQYYPV